MAVAFYQDTRRPARTIPAMQRPNIDKVRDGNLNTGPEQYPRTEVTEPIITELCD